MRPVLAGIIFVLVVFPCLFATLIMVGVRTWALDRGFYQEVLDDPILYETFVEEMPRILEQDGFRRDGRATPEDRANAALGVAFGQVVTPEYIRAQVNDLVDDIFVFFDNPQQDLNIQIDLMPVKSALAGPQGEDFARALAENLPPCEAGQEPRTESGALPRCITTGQSQAEVQQDIRNSLPGFIESIPDRWALEQGGSGFGTETGGQSIPAALTAAIGTMAFFALVFWVAVALVGGHNRRQIFLWLGVMMFIPGLMVLLMGLGIDRGIADNAIRGWDSDSFMVNNRPASPEVREAIINTLIAAARRIADGFLIAGGHCSGHRLCFPGVGVFHPAAQR